MGNSPSNARRSEESDPNYQDILFRIRGFVVQIGLLFNEIKMLGSRLARSDVEMRE